MLYLNENLTLMLRIESIRKPFRLGETGKPLRNTVTYMFKSYSSLIRFQKTFLIREQAQ